MEHEGAWDVRIALHVETRRIYGKPMGSAAEEETVGEIENEDGDEQVVVAEEKDRDHGQSAMSTSSSLRTNM